MRLKYAASLMNPTTREKLIFGHSVSWHGAASFPNFPTTYRRILFLSSLKYPPGMFPDAVLLIRSLMLLGPQ
jgi:hypothetical protein